MIIKKINIGLTLLLLFGSGVLVAADFNKGLDAYYREDGQAAFAEWIPLAEQGNADAQAMLQGLPSAPTMTPPKTPPNTHQKALS